MAGNRSQGITWIVAQLGARMHYAVPRLLYGAERLECFYTDIYAGHAWPQLLNALPESWLPSRLRRLLGRKASRLPRERVKSFPAFGLMYYARRSQSSNIKAMSAIHLWAGTAFCERVVRSGFGAAGAVYTFNTAALGILREARKRGLFTVVEQAIAPRAVEEDLLADEQARFPDWELQRLRGDAVDATVQREADEWALANLIVCGSEFVRDGIARCGGPVERCVVVPYGVDTDFEKPTRGLHNGPLRVLTVGEVCLRKGAPYVLEAARALQGVAELRWVGPVSLHAEARMQLAKYIQLTGSVPRTEMMPHYEWADVFFLPSICEGSATVTYEALSSGLPVITTPNAGSTIRDGEDGFITPVRDITLMIARLQQLHEDRELLARLSIGAVENARDLSLTAYRERLLQALIQ